MEMSYDHPQSYSTTSNEVGTQHERETPTKKKRTTLAGRSSGDLNSGLPKTNSFQPSKRPRPTREDTSESSPWDSESCGPLPRINTSLKLTAHVLLKAARKGSPSPQNIICSPLSLNFVMNMIAMGSKGETLQQLLSFIGSSSLDDVIVMSLRMAEVASPSSSGGPQISFANGIWVDQKFPLKPSFQDALSNTCKAEVKNVEMKQAERVIEEVNSWVNNNTKGLIEAILNRQHVDDTTAIILGNALYFKGVWADMLNENGTKHRNFYLLNGDTVSVPFMTSNYKYFFKACDGFKVLKVPYESGRDHTRKFSMYFLLPQKIDGLEDLQEKLNSTPEFLHQDFGLSITAFDSFWIPRFKFSYILEAEEVMQQLGLTLPFDMNCRDITEMMHSSSPVDNLYFSKVIQKAVIKVDEEGTKAAAVTFGLRRITCARSTKIDRNEFVADHPFLFMIREEVTGAVLFVGTVSNPLQQE